MRVRKVPKPGRQQLYPEQSKAVWPEGKRMPAINAFNELLRKELVKTEVKEAVQAYLKKFPATEVSKALSGSIIAKEIEELIAAGKKATPETIKAIVDRHEKKLVEKKNIQVPESIQAMLLRKKLQGK